MQYRYLQPQLTVAEKRAAVLLSSEIRVVLFLLFLLAAAKNEAKSASSLVHTPFSGVFFVAFSRGLKSTVRAHDFAIFTKEDCCEKRSKRNIKNESHLTITRLANSITSNQDPNPKSVILWLAPCI